MRHSPASGRAPFAVLALVLAACDPSPEPLDAGMPERDAGAGPEAGPEDAGGRDAGTPDAPTEPERLRLRPPADTTLEEGGVVREEDLDAPGHAPGVLLFAIDPDAAPGLADAVGRGDPAAVDLLPPRVRSILERWGLTGLTSLFPGVTRERLDGLAARFPERAARGTPAYAWPALDHVFSAAIAGDADVARAAEELARDPSIRFAQPDLAAETSLVPNDPFYAGNQWSLPLIGAPVGWDTADGTGLVVAVVDTGVDAAHPDLAGQLWTNPGETPGNGVDDDGNGRIDDVNGYDFAYNDAVPNDVHGHGSHVAGIVAASGDNGVGIAGLAFGARVMALKGLFDNGAGFTSSLAAAMLYAVTEGADVMNNSWGGGGSNPLVESIVDAAHAAGVLVVAAAGNSAANTSGFFPTGAENAFSVSATTPTDTLASYSNFGVKVDVAAPGGALTGTVAGDVLSTIPASSGLPGATLMGASGERYRSLAGTSMAAPHASALAALIWQAHPTWSVAAVRAAIKLSALDLGPSGPDPSFGAGRIRVDAALALPATAPPAGNLTSPPNGAVLSGSGIPLVGEASAGTSSFTWRTESGAGAAPTTFTMVGAPGTSPAPMGTTLSTLDSLTLPEGPNVLRLVVQDAAGVTHEDRNLVTVNNVFLTAPANLSSVNGTVTVSGSVGGTLGFSSYTLEWAPGCNATGGFTTILTSTTQVAGVGALGSWNTTTVTPGPVTLRLRASFSYGMPTDEVCVIVDPLLTPGFPVALPGAVTFRSPKLADLDGDGLTEIVLGGTVLQYDGSVRPGWPAGTGEGRINAVVLDVDGDGAPDVVSDRHDGNPAGPNGGNPVIRAWRADGTELWNFPVANPANTAYPAIYNAGSTGSLSAGDVDGDGDDEILFTTFFYYFNAAIDTRVFVLEAATGALESSFLIPGFGQNSIALADLDADGVDDLVTETWIPSPPPLGEARIFALHADGTNVAGAWPFPVPPTNVYGFANIDPVIADVDRDGGYDVLVGRYLLDAAGNPMPGFPSTYLSQATGGFASYDDDCTLEVWNGGGNAVRGWGLEADGTLNHLELHTNENLYVLYAGANGANGNPIVADVSGDGRLDYLRPAHLGYWPGPRPMRVYGSDASGGALPIFPRWVENQHPAGFTDVVRPTSAVGDLDGDGLVELVQVVNGQVYAWSLGTSVTTATGYWPMFQRDLRSTGRLPRDVNAGTLLGVDAIGASLYDVDAATGAVSNPRPTLQFAAGIARDAAGTTWMFTEAVAGQPARLYTVSPTTGATTLVTTYTLLLAEGDLAFHPITGDLYLLAGSDASGGGGTLYTVDTVTGTLTTVGASGMAVDPSAMAFDPTGLLYVHDDVLPGRLLTIDVTVPTILTNVPLTTGGLAPHKTSGMVWDAATGRLITAIDSGPVPLLISIDPATGACATLGDTSPALHLSGLTRSCE